MKYWKKLQQQNRGTSAHNLVSISFCLLFNLIPCVKNLQEKKENNCVTTSMLRACAADGTDGVDTDTAAGNYEAMMIKRIFHVPLRRSEALGLEDYISGFLAIVYRDTLLLCCATSTVPLLVFNWKRYCSVRLFWKYASSSRYFIFISYIYKCSTI